MTEVERQPTRSKRVREDRRFDKTQLRAAGHGRTVHRDYLAHALRWNFVAQEINRAVEYPDFALRYGWIDKKIKAGLKILDVGCGQDQSLLYVLGARLNTVPKLYVGVDLNRIQKKSNCRWAKVLDEFDFIGRQAELLEEYATFDVITNFEVIEHMGVEDGLKLLTAMRNMLNSTGVIYLSTPVFNGQAAANHVHEYTIDELAGLIRCAGLKVVGRYGTFASKPEIKSVLSAEERTVFDKLERWFGGEVLSNIFAPIHPDHSRNNLWVLQKDENAQEAS
jgi:2-polyprenyl-3-methyl-5-hydroxy-6-metoxy-1,4-benzoquinol methylase